MSQIDTSTWGRRLAYILLTGMVTVALAVLIAVIFQTWFNDPPIRVRSLDQPLDHALCPGDALSVRNQIEVDGPVLLYSYFSVMDATENHNINGTQVSNGPPRTHPIKSSFTQSILWTVPDLPPGNYVRVLAFRGTDGRENSIFSVYPFAIGNDCP